MPRGHGSQTGQSVLIANGPKIAALRKARGMTQQQLAKAAGMSQSAISLIESGFHPETLSAIAEALHVDVSEIAISGEDRQEGELTANDVAKFQSLMNAVFDRVIAVLRQEESK